MNYLVFDVGGSAIKYALINDNLEILDRGNVPTPKDTLSAFKQVIAEIYQKYADQIEGIAMSLPGLINKQTNRMQIPGALGYNQDVDILKELQEVTIPNFTIENDAKCAALCEVTHGSLQGTNVGAVCIIGTGIGGAVTIGNKVLTGCHGFSGEFSYLPVDWWQNLGWDERWASKAGTFQLIQMIEEAKGLERNSLDGYRAFELCNQGDKAALEALEKFCDLTASGLFSIQAVVDPDKIAIGGGISKQPILFDYLQRSLDKIYASIDIPIPQVTLVKCKYYNDSNLIGALANYKLIMKQE